MLQCVYIVTFQKFNHLPETSQDAEKKGWTKTASCGGRYFICKKMEMSNHNLITAI